VSRQEQHRPGELADLPADPARPSPDSDTSPETTPAPLGEPRGLSRDGDRSGGRGPRRRRLLSVVAGLLVVAGAAGVGGWVVLADRSSDDNTAAAAPAAVTAPVKRTTLVDRERYDGTLGYDDQHTVAAGARGTLTALREEGATVKRGQTLLRVDQRPLTLFYGTVPLYRTLRQDVSDGTDVKQLEENLEALGYGTDMTVDSTFTAATAEAVRDWQADRGLDETGAVDAGQVVFLPGQLRVGEHKASVGSGVQPGAPVLEVSSTTRVATVELPADDAGIAGVGDRVDIELPGGRIAKGTISEVGKVAKTAAAAEGEQSDPTITVTIRVEGGRVTGDLDQAPVKVAFVKQRKRDVLAVPVTALVALAEGGYAVELAEAGGTRLVGVETGMFAGGKVEVRGSGLREGQRVVVPA
jgi:peptidoglycan hydrolase-like protein with peptidoglycan-binding domain